MANLTVEDNENFVSQPRTENLPGIQTDAKGVTQEGIERATLQFSAVLTSTRSDSRMSYGDPWKGTEYKGVIKDGFNTLAECTQKVPNIAVGLIADAQTECHSTTDASVKSETSMPTTIIGSPRDNGYAPR